MRRYMVYVFSVLLLLSSPVSAEVEESLSADGVEQIEEQVVAALVAALKDAGISQEDLDVADELVANAESAGGFWDKEFFQKNKKAIKIGAAIATGAIVVGGGSWFFLQEKKVKDKKDGEDKKTRSGRKVKRPKRYGS